MKNRLRNLFIPLIFLVGAFNATESFADIHEINARKDPNYYFTPAYIRLFLPSNPIVIEAGAHCGSDTVTMSKTWPRGHIYAFEADPRIYPTLQRSVYGRKNISIYQLALGEEDGVGNFYLSRNPFEPGLGGQSSMFKYNKENWKWPHITIDDEPVKVPVTTIDSFMNKMNLSKVDFIWLDLQGSEFQVLKASPNALKSAKVIKTEISMKEFYQGTVLFNDLKAFLVSHGFELLHISTDHTSDQEHGDALFIKR